MKGCEVHMLLIERQVMPMLSLLDDSCDDSILPICIPDMAPTQLRVCHLLKQRAREGLLACLCRALRSRLVKASPAAHRLTSCSLPIGTAPCALLIG